MLLNSTHTLSPHLTVYAQILAVCKSSIPNILIPSQPLHLEPIDLSTFSSTFLTKRPISQSLLGNIGTNHLSTPGSRPSLWGGNGKRHTVAATPLGPWPDPLTSVAYLGEAEKSRQGSKHLFFSCSLWVCCTQSGTSLLQGLISTQGWLHAPGTQGFIYLEQQNVAVLKT